jgi:hypothetical protein
MNKTLNLDASTKVIGYSIFNKETCELIELSHWAVPKGTLLEKMVAFEKWLTGEMLIKHPEIDKVIIEESFVAMFGGKSSAKVTATLNQANFGYQLISYQLGLNPETITVTESRKYAFPTAVMKRGEAANGMKQKDQMFLYVLAELGEGHFPTKIISRGKRKGQEVFEDFCGDMSDSYIVGLGWMNKFIKKIKRVR